MRNATGIVIEALWVAVFGLIVALAANALSPRGLRLSRNYFPDAGSPRRIESSSASTNNLSATPLLSNASSAVAQRLQQRGLQLVASHEVTALFRDPRYEQGLVIFIDARDDQHYAAAHIPGAWQLDRFRPEQYLPTVLPACLTAVKVVVYCNGGECEDSEFAAIMLRDAGVPPDALFVYAGGITEWKANGLPMESGGRGSGQLLPSPP
jgi:rhodanese-related sulfurtransferase